jgi:hypothetical protein
MLRHIAAKKFGAEAFTVQAWDERREVGRGRCKKVFFILELWGSSQPG